MSLAPAENAGRPATSRCNSAASPGRPPDTLRQAPRRLVQRKRQLGVAVIQALAEQRGAGGHQQHLGGPAASGAPIHAACSATARRAVSWADQPQALGNEAVPDPWARANETRLVSGHWTLRNLERGNGAAGSTIRSPETSAG